MGRGLCGTYAISCKIPSVFPNIVWHGVFTMHKSKVCGLTCHHLQCNVSTQQNQNYDQKSKRLACIHSIGCHQSTATIPTAPIGWYLRRRKAAVHVAADCPKTHQSGTARLRAGHPQNSNSRSIFAGIRRRCQIGDINFPFPIAIVF